MLQANIKNKSNIYANNVAAFSKQTSISFNDYGIKYSALNSMFDARLPEAIISRLKPRKYEIKAITIDEYVENKGIRPDFIKIDAESSEYDILLGMEKTVNQKIHFYKVRHLVKSGITGLAQVNGWRGDTSIEERVKHDIYYMENWTFGLDIKIIWLTLFGRKTQKNSISANRDRGALGTSINK